MRAIRDLERYVRTIRYLRPRQIAARIDLRARASARTLAPQLARRRYRRRAARAGLQFERDPWNIRGCSHASRNWMRQDELQAVLRATADQAGGAFTFLNDRRALGAPLDWAAAGASQLWKYHLHYFDYLPDWVVAGESVSAVAARLTDWIARVRMADPRAADAWHPYVVSVRIVNWMLAIAASDAEAEWPDGIQDSLRFQTVFVRQNLETDVGGNHLLKNLKALAIAGCFWRGPGASRLRDRYLRSFVRELERQLRSDGGHYEQSPMYHAQVLSDAIDVALVLRAAAVDGHADLERPIERMTAFLQAVCHPDGQVAQFGDTALAASPDPQSLADASRLALGREPGRGLMPRHALLAARLAPASLAESTVNCKAEPTARPTPASVPPIWDPEASGFVTLPLPTVGGFLIADAGPVCPDELPAHAHSDLFGFEISVNARRLVVDSGVSEYTAGPWRDYFRSTRAHSTVMVDGAEQSDCWGSFRVARRAHVVDARFERGPDVAGFSASHTGFDHLAQPVRHRRRILVVADRFWLVVDDLTGSGTHEWTTMLHLHAEARIANVDAMRVIAGRDSARLSIGWFGIQAPRCVSGERNPLQGWYAPDFGRVVPAPTLIATGRGALPARFGWLLAPGDETLEAVPMNEGGGTLSIRVGAAHYMVTLSGSTGVQAVRTNGQTRDGADR